MSSQLCNQPQKREESNLSFSVIVKTHSDPSYEIALEWNYTYSFIQLALGLVFSSPPLFIRIDVFVFLVFNSFSNDIYVIGHVRKTESIYSIIAIALVLVLVLVFEF